MAQHNNDRVSDLMTGSQPKGGGFRPPARIPAPILPDTPNEPGPAPEPIREPPTELGRGTAAGIVPLHFRELTFSGFEPSDNSSSLFRLWKGKFQAVRSDGERFWVDVAFQQSDTPYVTGPVVESALEQLMAYSRCACRPSAGVTCRLHQETAS